MSTEPSMPRYAELIAHVLLQADAADAAARFDLSLPPRAGVLHVVAKKSDSIAAFREIRDWSLISWQPLIRAEASALHQAILSMPYAKSASDSRSTALMLVKDTSEETFNSLLKALTSPKAAATISRFLRSIALDAECPGA